MFPTASGVSARPEFSPLSLARMFWKSKAMIGLVWLVLCLLSVVVVFCLPARYRAEAVILVDRQKIPERIVASTVNAEVQDRLATISQQILATSRLQSIIVAYHLYERERARLPQEDIIEMMRQDTKITLEKGWSQDRTGAFRIAYQGRDPVIAAEVANQIGNLFIEENLRTRETHAEGTSEFLEEQLQQAKKTLDKLEVQVTEYKLKYKGELPEQENALAATLSRFELELRGNQDATNRAEQSKALLSTALSMAESTAKVLERSDAGGSARKDASGAGVKDAAALQAELDVLQSRYTDEYPDVQRVKQLLAKKKAGPEKSATAPASTAPGNGGAAPEEAEAAPEVMQQRERIASLKTELGLANRELEFRKAERREISTQIAALQSRLDKLPVREQELTGLSRDYEIAKANYKSLLDKRLAADMATDLERRQQGERFTMIDPAQPPARVYSPDRAQWIGICCALSLMLAAVAGLAREFKRNVLLGEWELPADIAILGRISPIGAPAGRDTTGTAAAVAVLSQS